MNLVQIRFDGDIVNENRVSMRTLAKTLSHTQNALDRAYLDIRFEGGVWKHARLPSSERINTEFLIEIPEPGSFLQRFISQNAWGTRIIDRFNQAMTQAVRESIDTGTQEATRLRMQLESQREQLDNEDVVPVDYQSTIENPDRRIVHAFGDRSIVKEVDQILALIRAAESGESTFELSAVGTNLQRYTFDKTASERFHAVVSERQLGDPVIYTGKISQLDRDNLKGKFKNAINDRQMILHMATDEDFMEIHPYLAQDRIVFIGAPLLEYGAFDPIRGDIYYLRLI